MQADIDHKAILFVMPKIIYVLFYNLLKTFSDCFFREIIRKFF